MPEDPGTARTLDVTCPHCRRAVLSEDQFCPHCGMRLDVVVESVPQRLSTHDTEDLLFARKSRNKVLLIIAALTLLLFALIAFTLLSIRGQRSEQTGENASREISLAPLVTQLNTLAARQETREDTQSLDALRSDLSALNTPLDEADASLSGNTTLSTEERADLSRTLAGLKEYRDSLLEMIDEADPAIFSERLNAAQTQANTAQQQYEQYIASRMSGPELALNPSFWILYTSITDFQQRQRVQAEQQAEQARKAEQISENERKAREGDFQSAQGIAESFMQAYIDGEREDMEALMTPSFRQEYDFSRLSEEERQYNYPVLFRVTKNEEKGPNEFRIEGTETMEFISPNAYDSAPEPRKRQNTVELRVLKLGEGFLVDSYSVLNTSY